MQTCNNVILLAPVFKLSSAELVVAQFQRTLINSKCVCLFFPTYFVAVLPVGALSTVKISVNLNVHFQFRACAFCKPAKII